MCSNSPPNLAACALSRAYSCSAGIRVREIGLLDVVDVDGRVVRLVFSVVVAYHPDTMPTPTHVFLHISQRPASRPANALPTHTDAHRHIHHAPCPCPCSCTACGAHAARNALGMLAEMDLWVPLRSFPCFKARPTRPIVLCLRACAATVVKPTGYHLVYQRETKSALRGRRQRGPANLSCAFWWTTRWQGAR